MPPTPEIEFCIEDGEPIGSKLVVGFASPGMASLAAVDHLVGGLESSQCGYGTVHGFPTATPFTDGTPRRAIRLYGTGRELSLLASEVFLPAGVGEQLADGVVDVARDHGIEEITVLYSVPYQHGPDEHAVFSVATEEYPLERLRAYGVAPLAGGFLDGFVGGLVERGLDSGTPSVGVFVTPAHPPGPDFDATLLLLDAASHHYDVAVDTTELEERSEEVHRYYQEYADRVEALADRDDQFEDRMFM